MARSERGKLDASADEEPVGSNKEGVGAVGSDARSLSDLFSGPAFVWSIAASVTQPIFDGGRIQSQIHAEEARRQQASASYRKTVAGAYFDLREAYAALDYTQQAYQSEGARVASLARAREIATEANSPART